MEDAATMYAIIFFALAFILFIMELFIPSGGLLGVLSIICVITAVVAMFFIDMTLGLSAMIVSLILIPCAVAVAVKVMPHTYVGRKLIHVDRQDGKSVRYEEGRDTDPKKLIGATGTSLSALRPVGTCKIGDDRLECLSIAGAIEAGTLVEVVSVDGIEIRVRQTES